MAHVRQQIRERVASLLTTANVASIVAQSRVYPLMPGNVAALVYATNETVEAATLTYPRKLSRTLSLIVEVMRRNAAASSGDLDDSLDTLCVAVEEAIAADQTLNGLADDIILASTQVTMSGDGDAPIGVARMEFIVSYRTTETDVETAV